MSNFSNNRSVKFIELRESGKYSKSLIEGLEYGNYEILAKTLESNQRANADFMEPILYAVKNEHGTYEVYKYYGENLQNNIELARDIVKQEPELIEDTPISNNPEYVLELSTVNPKIVKYMSPTLKTNSAFAEKLCESENKEVIQQVVKECKMPDVLKESLVLEGSLTFMKEAVKEDASLLKYAENNLKNDYEFIKEISSNNKEVIQYVSDNTEEFGKEALIATKESLVDISSEEAIFWFKDEKEKIGKELDSKDNSEKEKIVRRQKQLQRHIKLFERIKSGEIDPVRAAKLINKCCVNIDEEYKKEIEQLLKIDKAILDRENEHHEEVQKTTNRDEDRVSIEKIEMIINEQELSDIQRETNVTGELFKAKTQEEEIENGTNNPRT